jgi:ubiquinone/menaquinone biosynthesis C-methylase UbiE
VPKDEIDALTKIYNTRDIESFETGGMQDFARLMEYYDEDSVVLDLGCGIGRVAKYVSPGCKSLYGVDVSEYMLDVAAKRLNELNNITYVRCLDTVFPEISDESVDFAYCLLVLQHLEREDAFLLLEEIHRVLKDEGKFMVTFPNLLSDVYLDCFLNYAHNDEVTNHVRARIYTPQEVERLLPAAGFDVEILNEGVEIRALATKR